MKKIVILQPSYLPWIGHFNMMMNADVFVYFDNVQYTRRDWRNRNYILDKNGEKKLLTIPIHSKGNFKQDISEVRINYGQTKWIKQHLWLIKEAYRKSCYFDEIFSLLSNCLNLRKENLSNLCVNLNIAFANYLSIETKVISSSELEYNQNFKNASEHLLNICKSLGGTHYLSGPASKSYLNIELFEKHAISVQFHNYIHPVYQQKGTNFTAYLSIVDLLFRYGKESKNVLFQKMF